MKSNMNVVYLIFIPAFRNAEIIAMGRSDDGILDNFCDLSNYTAKCTWLSELN